MAGNSTTQPDEEICEIDVEIASVSKVRIVIIEIKFSLTLDTLGPVTVLVECKWPTSDRFQGERINQWTLE